jgi:hypothetical protein
MKLQRVREAGEDLELGPRSGVGMHVSEGRRKERELE